MKTIRKVTNLPADLVDEIVKFQKENYITTFTGAVIELIRRGLEGAKGCDQVSDVKWIKLSVNMFDDEKIKLIKTILKLQKATKN